MNDTEIKIKPFDCEKYGLPQAVAAKFLSGTTCLQYDNCKDRNNCIRTKPNQK